MGGGIGATLAQMDLPTVALSALGITATAAFVALGKKLGDEFYPVTKTATLKAGGAIWRNIELITCIGWFCSGVLLAAGVANYPSEMAGKPVTHESVRAMISMAVGSGLNFFLAKEAFKKWAQNLHEQRRLKQKESTELGYPLPSRSKPAPRAR